MFSGGREEKKREKNLALEAVFLEFSKFSVKLQVWIYEV